MRAFSTAALSAGLAPSSAIFWGTAEVAYLHGWSDAQSKLVGFEQLLYLRQPGYGPSYVVGKAQLDKMIARASHQAEASGRQPRAAKRANAAA